LRKVVLGEDAEGITEEVGWEGGGGLRVLSVAPSMFEEEDGIVVLAEWATNGSLAEVTAAQLGFEYEAEAPFSGRKGRTRLAVIDGLVTEGVVRALCAVVGDRERIVACGTAIDPAARPILKELRPGSTLRKIPSSILDEYRSRSGEPGAWSER
jgi:adenine-specific DNA-methyltransferase